VFIEWFPRDPPRITNLIYRSMNRCIREFVKEHRRRPRCGLCYLSADGKSVERIEFEPAPKVVAA